MTVTVQQENDKTLISLVENLVDISHLKNKKLTDEDRTYLLRTLKTLNKFTEPSLKLMKSQILRILNYPNSPSHNPYLSKEETRYIYRTLVLKNKE